MQTSNCFCGFQHWTFSFCYFLWCCVRGCCRSNCGSRVPTFCCDGCAECPNRGSVSEITRDTSLPPASTADHQPRGAPAHGELLAILPAPPADPARPLVGCGFCGREGDDARLLLTCSGCKWMRYCSAKHQRQHWYSNNKAYLLVISYFLI